MTTGRFSFAPRQERRERFYRLGMGLPVLSAADLLSSKTQHILHTQLLPMTTLSDSGYESFYGTFIQHFSEYVQLLPRASHRVVAGLLDEGLKRGFYALTVYTRDEPAATALERYALFTAATLLELDSVFYKQTIYITNERGHYVKEWNPWAGNLQEAGAQYYRIIPAADYPHLNLSIGLLAEKLLSREGFSWLTSNRAVFNDWLAALYAVDTESASRLVLLIQLLRRDGIPSEFYDFSLLQDMSDHVVAYPDTELAEKFLEWFQEEWENQRIERDQVLQLADGNILVLQSAAVNYLAQEAKTFSILLEQMDALFGTKHRRQSFSFGAEKGLAPGLIIPMPYYMANYSESLPLAPTASPTLTSSFNQRPGT